MKKNIIIAIFILIFALCTSAYAAEQLMATEQVYQEGDTVYEDLSYRVRGNTAVSFPVPEKTTETALTDMDMDGLATEPEKVYVPDLGIDYQALHAINSDTAAWLYCPDTVIDYPVMKADDYNHYLHYLPDGTENANGSLFIDYNNAPDFSSPLTVIYGHHMKSGKMFGSLEGYKKQEYYDEHPYMYLYTEEENYRIDLAYGFVIGAGQWRDRAFMYDVNTDDLLACAAYNTTFASDTLPKEGDRIVALSTCSYEFNDARYVIIGVIREGM